MEITIEDVKAFLKAEKVMPSDVFGAEVLTEDPAVKGHVAAEVKHAVAGEYAHRKRTEEGFDKTRQDLEDKLKAKDAEIQKAQMEAAKLKVGDLFAKQRQERKLDEQQAKFIEMRISRFVPSKIDDLEKEFNTFLDSEIDEHGRIKKEVFGIADDKDNGGKPRVGAETDNKQTVEPENIYVDPKTNPMIKLD